MTVHRWRTPVVMALVLVVGVVAFTWPFLASPGSEIAQRGHGGDASVFFVVLMVLMAAVLLAEMSSGGIDAKTIAVLGVLAAAGAALRVLSAGTAGLEPMFFLMVLAGRALGATRGFMLGALGDAGLGVPDCRGGAVDALPDDRVRLGLPGRRRCSPTSGVRGERWLLTAYGFVAGLAYGAVMNLWFWPFLGDSAPAAAGFVPDGGLLLNLGHYAVFYVTTSLAWDLPRGLLTALLTFLACTPVLRALRRSVRKARFEAATEFAR